MKAEIAHAIVKLRALAPQLAAQVTPATFQGLRWSERDWQAKSVAVALGWHGWKETGSHQLGLFGERRGPKGGVPWKRKRLPWLRVVFLNGARCASARPALPESPDDLPAFAIAESDDAPTEREQRCAGSRKTVAIDDDGFAQCPDCSAEWGVITGHDFAEVPAHSPYGPPKNAGHPPVLP